MLPYRFRWIEEIGPLPKIVAIAIQYLGVREVSGIKNNPVIIMMAKEVGVAKIYKFDSLAWCGLFISFVLMLAGKPPLDHRGDLYNLLRALEYKRWGQEVEIEDAMLGDLVILIREGGGHVAIMIAWSKDRSTVFLLGGNQGDTVSIAEFKANRIVAVRRFYALAPPISVRQYFIDTTGNLSTNES